MNHYVEYLRDGEREYVRTDESGYEQLEEEDSLGYIEIRKHGIFDENDQIEYDYWNDPDEPGLYVF